MHAWNKRTAHVDIARIQSWSGICRGAYRRTLAAHIAKPSPHHWMQKLLRQPMGRRILRRLKHRSDSKLKPILSLPQGPGHWDETVRDHELGEQHLNGFPKIFKQQMYMQRLCKFFREAYRHRPELIAPFFSAFVWWRTWALTRLHTAHGAKIHLRDGLPNFMELRFAAHFLVKLINAIERAGWVLNAEKKSSRNQSSTTGNNTSDTGGCCGQSTRPQSRTKLARMHVDSCREY